MAKKSDLTDKTPNEKGVKQVFTETKSNVIKAIDQNGDGTFDVKDISVIANSLGNAAKNKALDIKDNIDKQARSKELHTFAPIFDEDLTNTDFTLSKIIRITEIDKKRAESEVCKNSIGYISVQKNVRIINIFPNCVSAFGLSFYPDIDCGIYYVDPIDRNKYISLDEYFNYLKVARVNELQKIAQDLGAKYFRVIYKEQNASMEKHGVKAGAKANKKASADVVRNVSSADMTNVEIAAEMQFAGHSPTIPKLYYLKGETCIQSLISLRMDENSPVLNHKYTIKLSNSSGIKETDAVKIDAALKAMKIHCNATLTSEVKRESRSVFEYEIDF